MIDIHTHKLHNPGQLAVINIQIADAHRVLVSDISGLFSLGIHPWDIKSIESIDWDVFEKCMNDSRFVSVGECGFDKNCAVDFDTQKDVFVRQVAISEKFNKALIIHCVGYFNELIVLKKRLHPLQLWIIHGFRGKPKMALQLLSEGCSLSFGERFNAESVNVTPTQKIFIETDESEIPVSDIYQKIATIKGCDINQLDSGFQLFKKYIDKQ